MVKYQIAKSGTSTGQTTEKPTVQEVMQILPIKLRYVKVKSLPFLPISKTPRWLSGTLKSQGAYY